MKIKAQFIGDDRDPRTYQVGIRSGKKYQITIREKKMGWFLLELFRKKSPAYRVDVWVGRRLVSVPYSTRAAVLRNWRPYWKGHVGI